MSPAQQLRPVEQDETVAFLDRLRPCLYGRGSRVGRRRGRAKPRQGGPSGRELGTAPGQAERFAVNFDIYTTSLTGVTARHELAGTGPTTRWVRDPGGNLVSQRTETSALWYLTDGLGSTVMLVDAAGQAVGLYLYDPYGETAEWCGACDGNPWKFTGEYQDVTGMYKIGERYYSPELGRWTQSDPAANRINPGMPGEPNPYAYAGCNPINYTDPTGLYVRAVVHLAVGTVIFAISIMTLPEPITTATGVSTFGIALGFGLMVDSAVQVGQCISELIYG